MKRDLIACLETWADELKSRAERVRKLIGDAHWLSDGHHKEEIVREFLRRHLPREIIISRGFVVPANPELPVSKEIDILLTNAAFGLPWFAEGELTIAPPSAVLGQLHVKTKFSSKELADIFYSTNSTAQTLGERNSSHTNWCGALFFVAAEAVSVESLKEWFRLAITNIRSGTVHTNSFPDFIAVLGGPVFLLDRHIEDPLKPTILVRAFECPKLGPALLLNHLYDTLMLQERDGYRRSDWNKILVEEHYPAIFSEHFTY